MNGKVFNLISGVNERFLVHHELCETKCRSNGSVCNSKQNWNYDECWCEYKELDDWSSCKDDYMWHVACGIIRHVKLTKTKILKNVCVKNV